MIVIATQTISNNRAGHVTVELLKHDIFDTFFVYASNADSPLPELCKSAEHAIKTYTAYVAQATADILGPTKTIEMVAIYANFVDNVSH